MRLPFRRKETGALFVHPLQPTPKTIVLSRGFESTRTVRVFSQGWNEQAASLCPCALAASIDDLRRLARTGIELRYAVIVLTRGGQPDLSEQDRDLLWNAFGVPVFEQWLSHDNELLAAECEAHDGLHVVSGAKLGVLDTATCGCGSSVPRLAQAESTAGLELLYA